MPRPSFQRFPNKLPLLTVPLKDTAAACVLVLVRAGSRLENKIERGLSHFLEHMVFKGTEKRPTARDLTQTLDGVGADYNAFTAKEYTGYYVKVDARHLPLALDVLSDMLWHSRFEPVELEREKKVIVEEINMYEDNPMMYIGDVLEGAMFHGSTLGELISGTRQSVAALKRTQLLNFWQRYYHPNNMLLVTAGQLPESLDKLIAKTFGQVRAAGVQGQFKPFVPRQRAPQVTLHFKATEQVQAALGFPAFGWGDKRLPALKLLTTILGGNMSSRLFIRLREQEGLCYSVSASTDTFRGTGLLAVTAGLDQARLPLAIKLIRQELAKIVSIRVGEDEIARAKEYSRGRLTLALEDSAAQAEWVGRRWFLDGSRDTTAQYLKRLSAVTARELQAVAKQVLSPKQATLALIGPFRKTEPWRKLLN